MAGVMAMAEKINRAGIRWKMMVLRGWGGRRGDGVKLEWRIGYEKKMFGMWR
jgi:hypothetical protein